MAKDLHDYIHDEDAANFEKLCDCMDKQNIDCREMLDESEYWSVPTDDLLKRVYNDSVELMKYAVMLLFRSRFIDPDPDPLTRQITCIMTDEIRLRTSNLWHALCRLCDNTLPIAKQIDDAHRDAIMEACLDGWLEKERTSGAETTNSICPNVKPWVSNHNTNDFHSNYDLKLMVDDNLPKRFYTYMLEDLWETIVEHGAEEVRREIEAYEKRHRLF